MTEKKVMVELGESKTDLVHVKDVAKACLLALGVNRISNRVFNISGFELNAKGLVELLEGMTGRPVFVELGPSEDNCFPSNIDRNLALKELGYKPDVSLKEGLLDYLEHFDPNASLQR